MISEAQKRASEKYCKKTYDQLNFHVKKGTKERFIAAAESQGKSLAQFIVDSVESEIKRLGLE